MSDQAEGGNATNDKKPRSRKAAPSLPPFGGETAQPPTAETTAAAPLSPGNYRCKVKGRNIPFSQGTAAAYSDATFSAADATRFRDAGLLTVLYAV